jgi:hypothetical protein
MRSKVQLGDLITTFPSSVVKANPFRVINGESVRTARLLSIEEAALRIAYTSDRMCPASDDEDTPMQATRLIYAFDGGGRAAV